MFTPNSLLLYKNRPARLVRVTDRLEVELESGEVVKVRPKDVVLLHPGPLFSLTDLKPQQGEMQAAWEILAGSQTPLRELAELAYGDYTPATAWAAWQQVVEGLYFEGSPEAITAHSPEEVATRQREREHVEGERRAWQAFVARLKRAEVLPEDRHYLKDVESLALGQGQHSQALRVLGRVETPDNAHALLLELGVWPVSLDPYPTRLGVAFGQPDLPVPPLQDEPRLDLTHLAAFAIDDEGTDTPDDAISLDGARVWVHVADPAALISPDSPLDLEARARALTLHLPEGAFNLLPRALVEQLGLGLQPESPALSFGIDIAPDGQVVGFEVVPSRVRIQRLTYEQAEERMDQEPLRSLGERMAQARARRRAAGAVMLDFPEVKISVSEGQVILHPILPLRSRALVEEAMILVGTETARFATRQPLGLVFSQQDPPETGERPQLLSGMFAIRRLLKRSRYKTEPGPHSGLGVDAYTQVTSPLRRYLDLVSHQQLRALLTGQPALTETDLMERIGAVETVMNAVRQAEILAEKHWTVVYLIQNPQWRGEGIVVEKRGGSGVVLIPSLGLEARLHLPHDEPLDCVVMLRLTGVNLAQRDAIFRVEGRAVPN